MDQPQMNGNAPKAKQDLGAENSKLTPRTVWQGISAAMVCSLAGGALIMFGDGASMYGLTMFLFLPAVTGFVKALRIQYWTAVVTSLIISIAIIFLGLVMTEIEGIVCVVMASPIFLMSALIDAAFGISFNNAWRDQGRTSLIVPMIASAIIFAVGKAEDQVGILHRQEVIVSTIAVDDKASEVWQSLIEFSEVQGEKPLLMEMGLPEPVSYSMEGGGIGARRICHFNSDSISERVTQWDPPHQLMFEIEEVKLPGRHWLGFTEASCEVESLPNGRTFVKRSTR